MIHVGGRVLVRLLVLLLAGRGLDVRGWENIPRRGSLVITANHAGIADPALLGALVPRRDLHYVARSEHLEGTLALFLRAAHAVRIVRGDAGRGHLDHALELLRSGHAVLVFPEILPARDGVLRRPEPGAAHLAQRAGATVVPVAVWGSGAVLRGGARPRRRAVVRIRFGEAFTLPERGAEDRPASHQEAAELVMARIAELMPVELRGPYAAGRTGPDTPGAIDGAPV